MSKQLIKVDHKKFGLVDAKASEIVKAFVPAFEKMKEYEDAYSNILKKKQSKELSKEAKELRLKFVKIRTATSEIHKGEKSMYLKAGKFVDAIKNMQLEITKEAEGKLASIENYEKIKEQERIDRLQIERIEELEPYIEDDAVVPSLGEMEIGIWEAFKTGIVSSYKKRVQQQEDERIRLEQEKIKAEEQRKKLAELERQQKLHQAELRKSAEAETAAKRKEEEAKRQLQILQEKEKKEKEKLEFKQNEADAGMNDYEAMISMMVDLQSRVSSTVFIDKEYIKVRGTLLRKLVATTKAIKTKFKK